jgi:hypothetical protein
MPDPATFILVLMITARGFTVLDALERPMTQDQCETAGEAWDQKSKQPGAFMRTERSHECLPTEALN